MTGKILLFILGAIWILSPNLIAQHQTETFSPVVTNGVLPYRIDLVPYDLGDIDVPTLHSFAKAQVDGKWLLIGGRTNGLHAFTQNGFENFPPAFQNRHVWVVDPVNRLSWSRALDGESSGLSVAQVDSLSVANNQFAQTGDRLYMTGGYGYQTDFDFVTFDALTSIDVPGLMSWVQGGDTLANDHIRQIYDPIFTVTGGAMYGVQGKMQLVFGQDFQGEYTPFGNGVYTNQVRSFTVLDDGIELSIQDVSASTPNDAFRRRDLNVMPVIRSDEEGSRHEELRVLSGVFTPQGGTWTVPVAIDASGNASMANPSGENTFKQAMNHYHSAKFGLYSEKDDQMHMLLFGGISLNYFDRTRNELIRDDLLPFINQSTSIVLDGEGNYTQYLLPHDFPEVYDQESGLRLRFGTNAEFMVNESIATYENGVIRMDEIDEPTVLGYVFGGIAADQPNRGNTAASGRVFEVVYTPIQSDGDLDQNGIVDARDIDFLAHAMGTNDPESRLDLDQSGVVEPKDVHFLVENILHTWIGDVNLDGEFNTTDLVEVFRSGQFEDEIENNSSWAEGDWNADLDFTTGDLVSAFQDGGFERGKRNAAIDIPEPSSLYGILVFCGVAIWPVRPRIGFTKRPHA